MPGVKGRTGVPRTPEQRRLKADAAALGRSVLAAAKRATGAPSPTTLPKRPATIADYDKVLGDPRGWTDAKTREQVQAEILTNEKLTEEALQRRGRLLTREQVSKRDQAFEGVVLEQLKTVAELISDIVPPDKRVAAQIRASAWVAQVLTHLARKPA